MSSQSWGSCFHINLATRFHCRLCHLWCNFYHILCLNFMYLHLILLPTKPSLLLHLICVLDHHTPHISRQKQHHFHRLKNTIRPLKILYPSDQHVLIFLQRVTTTRGRHPSFKKLCSTPLFGILLLLSGSCWLFFSPSYKFCKVPSKKKTF